jgi:hypothetical protein
MTWAGVNVTASATTIGKDIQNITGELRQAGKGTKVKDFAYPNAGALANEVIGAFYNAEIAGQKAYLLEGGDFEGFTPSEDVYMPTSELRGQFGPGDGPTLVVSQLPDPANSFYQDVANGTGRFREYSPNLFYVPLTVSRGGNFPVELMLAPTQSFSAVCGAFNAIVIREDGT